MNAPEASFEWVTQSSQLEVLAKASAKAPWIALDTESNSMFVYRERVCLIQLNVAGTLHLIDPLCFGEAPEQGNPSTALEMLRPALEDRAIPKLLHGGEYDVCTLARDFGIRLAGIFDSQQAALLLGWEKTGYGAVVERILGVKLAKDHTKYDWGTRPIDPKAIDYAVDDVRHLPDVCANLKEEITRADLEEELAIDLRTIEQTNWRGGFDPSAIWRMGGANRLSHVQMRVLFALHCQRDQLAKRYDRPAGQFINDRLLVAMAIRRPTSDAELKHLGMRASLVSAHSAEFLKLIQDPLKALDKIPFPERPERREASDEEKQREACLRTWRQSESKRRKMTPHAILPARALMWLKTHGADALEMVPQLGEKRIRLYGTQLKRICQKGQN